MGAAIRSRRPEGNSDPSKADAEAKGGEPRPAVARSQKAAEQKDEDRLGAHHQRHVGARRQLRRLAQQQERNDLPDQREGDKPGP